MGTKREAATGPWLPPLLLGLPLHRGRGWVLDFDPTVSRLEINVGKRLAARVLNDKAFVQPHDGPQPRKRRDLTVAGTRRPPSPAPSALQSLA
jgi:hypothetical protein